MEPTEREAVFTNHGRAHPILRSVAFLLVFTLLSAVVAVPVLLLARAQNPGITEEEVLFQLMDPASALFRITAWLLLGAVWLSAAWFTLRLDRQPVAALGLQRRAGWQRELATGLLLGLALIAPIWLLLVLFGRANPHPALGNAGAALATALLALVPMAVSEELLFRGYLQRNLTQALGGWPALILMGILFSFFHLQNPERSFLAMLNIGLAGVLLGYPYWRSGSLWLPLGLHFSWNAAQGSLFGMPVSGIGVAGLVETSLRDPYWLSGGPFGPEGSILATVAMAAGLAFLIRRYRAQP